jgi:hypothetical protein
MAAGLILVLSVGQLSAARMPSGVGPHGEPLSLAQVRSCLLAMPYHHLSAELRQRRAPASGPFELRIDPKTGRVKEVRVLVTTHDAALDRECAEVCVGWQFKPGDEIARHAVDLSEGAAEDDLAIGPNGHGVNDSVRAAAGVKACVRAAVGVEPGDAGGYPTWRCPP